MKAPNPTPSARLRCLVDRRLDRSISRMEMAELEQLLRDPDALNYYRQCAEQIASLELLAESGEFAGENGGEEVALLPSALPERNSSFVVLSAAAVVALLCVLGIVASSVLDHREDVAEVDPPEREQPKLVAAILRSIGPSGLSASEIRSGDDVELPAGLVEIEFDGGAHVLLEGPASLEITGTDGATLRSGRCVVEVPRSASPFELASPAGSFKVREGEFAAVVEKDRLQVGVFEGYGFLKELAGGKRPQRVNYRGAVQCDSSGELKPIAFQFDSFLRSIPSSNLEWKAPENSFATTTIEHDLTGLVWGEGSYRLYYKWMRGADALIIHKAEVLYDGEVVAQDVHQGKAGDARYTEETSYAVTIPEGDYVSGKWTLRTVVQANSRKLGQVQISEDQLLPGENVLLAGDSRVEKITKKILENLQAEPDSQGVVMVESGELPGIEDYCHTWEYTVIGATDGAIFHRIFYPDGTAQLICNGNYLRNFELSTWELEDGVLVLTDRDENTGRVQVIQRHLVRSDGTLVFLNEPYSVAHRLDSPPARR